jgi:NAD(P)-dependent dehydrogenase (short-subunit alcohol dehydrogenase family)
MGELALAIGERYSRSMSVEIARRAGNPDPAPVALITGAARGVGAACARRFAAAGYAVILADRRLAEAEQVVQELREAGRPATAIDVDLTIPAAIEELARLALAAYGRVDLLVNNAGIILPKGFATSTAEEWDGLFAVNLRAAFLLSRELLPELRRRGGCIVNVASTAGIRAQFDNGPYCTAKSGLIMLSQSLAQETLADGVRVNCVCPGAIDTPLLREYVQARGTENDIDRLRADRMLVPPEDIADAVFFLASSEARSITGHALVVDRGALLR